MPDPVRAPEWLLAPVEASKASLLETSLRIEQLTTLIEDEPRPVLVGLFQDAEYVRRSVARFERLGQHAHVVLVHAGPAVVERATHVEIAADEPLAREWSMIAVGRGLAAALVGFETGEVTAARTIERGRTFAREATTDPARVLFHVDRVLHTLGERAPTGTVTALTDALASRGPLPAAAAAAVEELEAGLAADADALALLRAGDPDSALTGGTLVGSHAAFHAWVTDAGPRCPILGVVALRRHGQEAGATDLLDAVRDELPRGAITLAPAADTLVVVVAGWTGDRLEGLSDRLLGNALRVDRGSYAVRGTLDPMVPLLAPFLIGLGRARAGALTPAG